MGRGDFYDGMQGWTYLSQATPGHPASNNNYIILRKNIPLSTGKIKKPISLSCIGKHNTHNKPVYTRPTVTVPH